MDFEKYQVLKCCGLNPCPEYVPTHEELVALLRIWYEAVLENRWWYRQYGLTGGTERREHFKALEHVYRIANILGEISRDILDEVEEGFEKKMSG